MTPPSPSAPSTSELLKIDDDIYDFIGIGFGPANLALSIAFRESQEAQDCGLKFTFVEKQAHFAWHSTLLLPGAQLQVSPLKDLATMRDPTSSYTFFNYLHQKGRLAAYINREASVPSRREWSAYLTWAAERMDDTVTYNQEVVSVEAEEAASKQIDASSHVRYLRVTTRDLSTGHLLIRLTKNVSVGVGGVPRLPLPFHHLYRPYSADKIEQIAHSSTYLPSLAVLEPMLRDRESKRLATLPDSATLHSLDPCASKPAPLRFAVIGSGQSSAEISLHLRRTFPKSQVKVIFRSSAMVPSDDSPFVNAKAFDPSRTDVFWQANEESRKAWLKEYRRTNYSVVRSDVLNQINSDLYDQNIDFDRPWPNADGSPTHGILKLLSNTVVEKVEMNVEKGMVQLTLSSSTDLKAETVESFDAVFVGTGYERQPNAIKFLDPIKQYFPLLDQESELKKAELGFANEAETDATLNKLMESNDEFAVERLRQRTRGIARDYRLVNYWSEAFTHSKDSGDHCNTKGPEPIASRASSTERSGTSSPLSSSETLGETGLHQVINGKVFEPSVFFLGGNEQTHGLSDSLLSIVAHRAGELCETIIKSRAGNTANTSSALGEGLISSALSGGPGKTKTTVTSAGALSKLPIETLEEKIKTLQST
ncbi:hypothetical protein CBS101457_004387 [Exobasidium rhododendri]|nr:hypothetical protein CBS101457_004387 [Exobasidium rhododendri]